MADAQETIVQLEARLQALVEHYAVERGEMAEKLSQLLEENDQLKRQVKRLENTAGALEAGSTPEGGERGLTFDFSLPDRQ
ncbi:hypothetical protein PZ78_15965 [Vreelandella venusta]|nr:hypothetical protein PZ78_15965 [Halomonas hydrothermalis]